VSGSTTLAGLCRRTTAAGALGLLALGLAGCSAPRACLRPGYHFVVLEPDGSPAADARVTFQQVERDEAGHVVRELGREVTLSAAQDGAVLVGPYRGRAPKPEPPLRRYTRVVVAMPDGRRVETFHAVKPRVACKILEAEPIVLQTVEWGAGTGADTETGD